MDKKKPATIDLTIPRPKTINGSDQWRAVKIYEIKTW